MTPAQIHNLLDLGENIAIEFKRGGNGIEFDTYETVCSFLNRFGGDILIGVDDNGAVRGISRKAALDMVKNFINVVSNPTMFLPTVYLVPEIVEYDGRCVIHIHVPQDSEIHALKGIFYDRVGDSDVKLKSAEQIASLSIRKQCIFTERRVFPEVKCSDMRMDMLPDIRLWARNNTLDGKHPWTKMSDVELFKSAKLYQADANSGKEGFNLAAIMLLGKDDTIRDICPCYKTDALLRKVNVDRYDDRCIVQTNIIDSYMALVEFASKHLLDKFFLEETQRLSLAGIISREMLANSLIHREYSSHFPAKFVIMKEQMYVENACRARQELDLTPENFTPDSKNPYIASFFRNIGLADELGSGVRRLFKYVPFYSGKTPIVREADVFRITIPLDELYSFDNKTVDLYDLFYEKNTHTVAENTNTVNENTNTVDIADSTVNDSTVAENTNTVSETTNTVSETTNTVNKRILRMLFVVQEVGESEVEYLLNKMALKNKSDLHTRYIRPAMALGYIEQTQPKAPHSPTQKYRLTARGQALLHDRVG